jgi:hypothetical protein
MVRNAIEINERCYYIISSLSTTLLYLPVRIRYAMLILFKKLINNSRGKYKRNECLINVCKSDTDLS